MNARHERPNATVVIALCREHQLAVPVAERSIGDAHHVEQGQTDSGQSLIVGEYLEVTLTEHQHRAGQFVHGQWAPTCRGPEDAVQIAGEGSTQIDRRIDVHLHDSPICSSGTNYGLFYRKLLNVRADRRAFTIAKYPRARINLQPSA